MVWQNITRHQSLLHSLRSFRGTAIKYAAPWQGVRCVSNAQYELLPAEKYSYKGPDGEEEATHFYLPAALAVPLEKLNFLLEKAYEKN